MPIGKGQILPIRRGPISDGSCSCQSGRVMFCQPGGVQTRRVLFLPIRKGKFLPIRRVPIRRGPDFANPKWSSFPNPEGSQFGGVLSEPIRKSHILPIWRGENSDGCCFYQSVRVSLEQISGRIGCLFDELVETGEVGFNRHVKL